MDLKKILGRKDSDVAGKKEDLPMRWLHENIGEERSRKFDEFYGQNRGKLEVMAFGYIMTDPAKLMDTNSFDTTNYATSVTSMYRFLSGIEKKLRESGYKLDLDRIN